MPNLYPSCIIRNRCYQFVSEKRTDAKGFITNDIFVQGENTMSDHKQLKLGKTPNTFIFSVLGLGIAVNYARFKYGIHVKKNKEVARMEGPLIFVGNHPSYLDPFVMILSVYGRKVNLVAGAFLFRDRIIGPLFALGGCIPKVQFRSDARAVKAMLTVLKNKGTLGIFPEGTRFVDGTSITFDDALSRMIKKTGSGVAFIESHGAYSTWPRWSTNSYRRGRIEGGIKLALSPQEVEKLSLEELSSLMKEQMTYNEYDWLRKNPRVFHSKAITAGAQNIAYACPRCEKDNVMESDIDILRCKACGNQMRMDSSGFLHPVGEGDKGFEDLHLWALWERDRMRTRIMNPDFSFVEKTRLLLPWGEFEYREVGEGEIRFENGQVIYHGKQCAVENGISYSKKELKAAQKSNKSAKDRTALDHAPVVTKTFDVLKIRGIGAEYGKRFELTEAGGQINRFIPENGQSIFAMQMAIQCMQEIAANP